MGAWGPAVFSSDLACDVRDDLKDALGDGLTDEEAVRRVLDDYSESLDDEDEADEIWIALAATLSSRGRLTDAVRDRALQAIDSGRSVSIWAETPGGAKARGVALAKLRASLTMPQRAAKRVSRRKLWIAPFETGDVLRIALEDGRAALAFVGDAFSDNGGHYNGLRLLREDDGRPFQPGEFLSDPLGPEASAVLRDFLVGGPTLPALIVRVAQGARPPDESVHPPYRIESWKGGWRLDFVGAVTSWRALPVWAAAFLDGRVLEPPFPF